MDSGCDRAAHHTAAGNETGLVTQTLAGMKGSLPEIIWYSTTPTLLQRQTTGNRQQGSVEEDGLEGGKNKKQNTETPLQDGPLNAYFSIFVCYRNSLSLRISSGAANTTPKLLRNRAQALRNTVASHTEGQETSPPTLKMGWRCALHFPATY